MNTVSKFTISAFYKFAQLNDLSIKRDMLLSILKRLEIKGTVLLAEEGINGTITGEFSAVNKALNFMKSWPGFSGMEDKRSYADFMPFSKTKVKIKPEIVVLKESGVKPAEVAGDLVAPRDWNALITQDDVITLDTRNDYEVGMGTFKGAVNPDTKIFTDFKTYVAKNLNPKKHKRVAMFCTGGIRCEKASAYMLKQGFKKVYQLHGGIFKYLEEVPSAQSLWQGECFVFDDRIAVNHNLEADAEGAKKRPDRSYFKKNVVSAKYKKKSTINPITQGLYIH